MGKTGPGWKAPTPSLSCLKTRFPACCARFRPRPELLRGPRRPPRPRPSSVPGSDASFASRTAARSLCPFVVSHRLQAPTQNLHFSHSFKSKKCHFAGPRTPARSRPSLFSVAPTSPPCFQPSSCPGLRLGPRSLPSPRDFGP